MRRFWLAFFLCFVAALLVSLLAQSATYPAGVVSFTTKTAGQTIQSAHVNTIQAEITAVENALLNGLAHVVKPLTDATYDLGTGSFRWRDGFFSRNVTMGGTLTVPALVGGWTVVTSTSTGTLNDFAPGLVGNTVVRMNNATLATITGFSGGADGQRLIVESVGAGQVDFAYATSAAGLVSAAANRLFNFATSGNTSEAAGVGTAEYVYDGTAARWRLVAHEQGAWITPATVAGNFTASTGTWSAVTPTTLKYWLKGRTLTVAWYITGTTVSATPTQLLVANGQWGGFTSASNTLNPYTLNDNGAGNIEGPAQATAAGTQIALLKNSAGAFATATTATNVFGELVFEVQD